jgi:hypothetical protein
MVATGMATLVVGASAVGASAAATQYPALGASAIATQTVKTPVLGSKVFAAPSGTGWGSYKPAEIYNGGDPSGMVKDIVWSHWGDATATGIGKAWIFKPGGGYYPVTVTAELRTSDLGHCTVKGPLAYRRLDAREPSKPGGKLGAWFAWSGAKTLCKPGF